MALTESERMELLKKMLKPLVRMAALENFAASHPNIDIKKPVDSN